MAAAQYIAFVGVSLLVICTPGQDTALTIRNTLLGGRGAGIATAAGVSSGQAIWTIATSAGLAVLVLASAPIFAAVRLAGAAYLVYLGLRSLLKAARDVSHARIGSSDSHPTLPLRAAFLQGVLSNLSNAKMVAFFIGFLPPVAGPHPTFLLMLALGFNFCLLTLGWLVAYAFTIERFGQWLRRSAVRRSLDAALGAVLVALGLRVGAEAIVGV